MDKEDNIQKNVFEHNKYKTMQNVSSNKKYGFPSAFYFKDTV